MKSIHKKDIAQKVKPNRPKGEVQSLKTRNIFPFRRNKNPKILINIIEYKKKKMGKIVSYTLKKDNICFTKYLYIYLCFAKGIAHYTRNGDLNDCQSLSLRPLISMFATSIPYVYIYINLICFFFYMEAFVVENI